MIVAGAGQQHERCMPAGSALGMIVPPGDQFLPCPTAGIKAIKMYSWEVRGVGA